VNRIWLLPLSYLYGLGVWIRNRLYDWNILTSEKFPIAVVKVGNLTTGGTGKTPHTELVAAMLMELFPTVAILSRGYRRKTQGFRLADPADTPETIGDEAFMLYQKLPGVMVAVCEDRAEGIRSLLKIQPYLSAVILDDGLQHRKVEGGLNLLLSDFNRPFFRDYLLPVGTLRESAAAAYKADLILFTKTPGQLSLYDKKLYETKVKPAAHQTILFTTLQYGEPVFIEPFPEWSLTATDQIVVVTGIAHADSLITYIKTLGPTFKHLEYPDHHVYEQGELNQIEEAWRSFPPSNGHRYILCTEKDFVKLAMHATWFEQLQIPLAYLPVEIGFDEHDRTLFIKRIESYVRQHQRNT